MKKITLIIAFTFILFGANGQNTATITVENVNTNQAIQIIENVAKDLNYSLDKYDKKNKILITKIFEWTSIVVQNHAKLKFEAANNKVVITMIERQYNSKEGWVNTPTKLSKKNIEKYLGNFANKIIEISANKELLSQSLENSVLIKMFKPILKKEGLVFKFVKATKNMEGENFSIPNTVLELDILNTKKDTMELQNPMVDNGAASFIEPKTEIRFRIYSVKIAPDETAKLFFYLSGIEYDIIEKLSFNFGLNSKNIPGIFVELTNYNIKVPFENKKDVEAIDNDPVDLNKVDNLENKLKKGVYDNCAIVKTGNPEMQLMAIHEDGSMIGYQLDKKHERVLSLSYRKDNNSTDFVLLFDEKGNPRGGGFGDYVYVFQKIEGDNYNAITLDKEGNRLNETTIELTASPNAKQLIEPNNNKGPSAGAYYYYSVTADRSLHGYLDVSTRILNGIGCAVSLPSGLGAIGPCGTLIIDEILRVLPKDHIYYDELVLAKELLSFATFSSPAGFLDKLTTITAAMTTSVGVFNDFVNNYFPEVTLNELKPFISTSEKEYKRVKGIAVPQINYSKFSSDKDKTISIYKIETDGSTLLSKEFNITKSEGELAFELYFNGNYEVRVLYDNVLKNKILFSVVGDDAISNAKFKNFKCIYFTFSGGIHTKYYYPNVKPEPETTSILPFDIEYGTCIDSEKNDYHLTPLNISWSGNSFMATAKRKFSFSTVTYNIKGEISNDGKILKNINIKVTSIWEKEFNKSVDKSVKDVTLGNIPYDEEKKQFISYKNKYGSIPDWSNAIKLLKYKKTVIFQDNKDAYFLVKYVPIDEYKTSKDGNFSFKLGFSKPK